MSSGRSSTRHLIVKRVVCPLPPMPSVAPTDSISSLVWAKVRRSVPRVSSDAVIPDIPACSAGTSVLPTHSHPWTTTEGLLMFS